LSPSIRTIIESEEVSYLTQKPGSRVEEDKRGGEGELYYGRRAKNRDVVRASDKVC